ncbi:iron chelate uptake ABC transporter family permease subunit [Oerskovia sp. M15]
MSGALIQGITRNPLGDPGLLGVNAGASAAVVAFTALTGAMIVGSGVMPVAVAGRSPLRWSSTWSAPGAVGPHPCVSCSRAQPSRRP